MDPAPAQPAPKVSPVSLPSSALSNHNNNVKHEGGLKSGVSLDAAALAKQMQKPYANVGAPAENGVLPSNGPYVVQNQAASKFLGSAEISC